MEDSVVTKNLILFHINGDGVLLSYNSHESAPVIADQKLLIGKNIIDILPSDVFRNAKTCMDESIRTGNMTYMQYQLLIEKVFFDFEATFVPEENSGFLIIISDVTDNKKLDQEFKLFKMIADDAGYGVSITDLSDKFIYVNNSFAQMHGFTAEELIGVPISLVHLDENISNNCDIPSRDG